MTLAYSTFPAARQFTTDRYRGAITAERDRREGLRTIDFSIFRAIDVDVWLPPLVAPPSIVVLGTAPQVQLETRFPVLPNAIRYEAIALAQTNRRSQRIWHATLDAKLVGSGAEVVDTMPDLSALPGWKSSWALPVGVSVTVTTRVYETPQPLGDGTVQRATGNSATITP